MGARCTEKKESDMQPFILFFFSIDVFESLAKNHNGENIAVGCIRLFSVLYPSSAVSALKKQK